MSVHAGGGHGRQSTPTFSTGRTCFRDSSGFFLNLRVFTTTALMMVKRKQQPQDATSVRGGDAHEQPCSGTAARARGGGVRPAAFSKAVTL